MVLITEDPAVADREVQRYGGQPLGEPPDDLAILYFGDPAALPASTAAGVCVVTTSAVPASDLSVMVDHQGASIHPLARTVHPDLVAADAALLLDELVELPTNGLAGDPGTTPEDDAEAEAEWVPGVIPDLADLGPGLVEVKLLTMTPRLEGLAQPAARPTASAGAVGLVAYLGLHRPDNVTSDRLRTRVLGSADADAAAKTLFNTATAAAPAGLGPRGCAAAAPGHPHRPLHAVARGDGRCAAGRRPGRAGPRQRGPRPGHGLLPGRRWDLVEQASPWPTRLAGYTWWESEGHGGRVAAVLVHTACNLAALAVQAGRFELAQWGLEQKRLVDPYSESLSRAAMAGRRGRRRRRPAAPGVARVPAPGG